MQSAQHILPVRSEVIFVMKRMFILFICLMLLASASLAKSEVVFAPEATLAPEATPTPAPEMTPAPQAAPASEGDLMLDFSVLQPDNPLATPVAIDPIDKPTPTPTPAPNFFYDTYTNEQMGISFQIPSTWLLNPNTNQETTVQFVEPQSEMMDVGGYQTRITIEKLNMGLVQTADDARTQLMSTLDALGLNFTTFEANDSTGTVSIGDADGYYCYYRADYNDGTKDYAMNGRIMVVAYDRALYQIRITAPRNWYSYYNVVYRQVRNTFKFLD